MHGQNHFKFNIISLYLSLGLQSGLFPSGFLTKNLRAFILSPTRVTSVHPYRQLSNLLSLRSSLSLSFHTLYCLSIHQTFFSLIFVHHFPLSLFHIPSSQMGGQYSCWKGPKLYSRLQHQQSSRFAFCHPLNITGMHKSRQPVQRRNLILYGGGQSTIWNLLHVTFLFFFFSGETSPLSNTYFS